MLASGMLPSARSVTLVIGLACLVSCDDEPSGIPDEDSWRNWAAHGSVVYEKNPEVTLAREYWATFVNGDGTRGMYPRPDGDTEIYGIR